MDHQDSDRPGGRQASHESAAPSHDEAVELVRAAARPLPDPDEADAFGAAFDRFGDARVVLLGESTHGTSEFYRARAAITRRLIERHGFSIVAVEADWPDAARIDAHVRHRAPPPADGEAFGRFPTWMWRNAEVAAFVEWMRAHDARLPEAQRAEFRGLDIYSLASSMSAVLEYLDKVDPGEAKRARFRYGCLSPWQARPERYGLAVWTGDKTPCEDQAIAQLQELLERRFDYLVRDGQDFLDAEQNARIVQAAEHYYRIMYRGSTESWNLRDTHMADTLARLLQARGPRAKAVVWAHNSHIGDARATSMGREGQLNLGQLARERLAASLQEPAASPHGRASQPHESSAQPHDVVLIGFGTDRGEVAAADDWGDPVRIHRVLPAREDSHEAVFRDAGIPRALVEWRSAGTDPRLREALAATRLERAIGVVYRPDTELYSHYFEAELSRQFDAFVWFDRTRAVEPLSGPRPEGVPDTYPFGL